MYLRIIGKYCLMKQSANYNTMLYSFRFIVRQFIIINNMSICQIDGLYAFPMSIGTTYSKIELEGGEKCHC